MSPEIESLLQEWVDLQNLIIEKKVHHIRPLTEENRQIIIRCKAVHLKLKKLGHWAGWYSEHELGRLRRERLDKKRENEDD